MFDNFAVHFGYSVSIGVAVIDHSIELVKLAYLVLCVNTGQILSCHQVGAQSSPIETCLSGGGWGHTDYKWTVIHGAEYLKSALLGLGLVIVFAVEVFLVDR